jgi:hypothetical protein
MLTNSKGQGQDFIGRMTTAGAVKLFPVSPFSSHAPWLQSIAVGADGNLWFTEYVKNGTRLSPMTPSGVVTQFPVGDLDGGSVANGLDGSLILNGQNPEGQTMIFRRARPKDSPWTRLPSERTGVCTHSITATPPPRYIAFCRANSGRHGL